MKKLKRQYIKYLLRPLRALKLSLIYFYGRIVLSLAIFGIKLPWLNYIKKKMTKSALGVYERKILVYSIKGERYSIRKGPLWFRRSFDFINYFISRNKFWLLAVIKTGIAFFVIAIPILIFVLLRGVLPVPERVPYEPVSLKLFKQSRLRTDWLYTEGPYPKQKQSLSYNYIDPSKARGVNITPVLEKNSPPGLIHFGIGYYPQKFHMIRGFLASEHHPLIVKQIKTVPIEVDSANRLRIQYYLFPSKSGSIKQCQIKLYDNNGKELANKIQNTPPYVKKRNPNSFSTAWNERFVPNQIPNFGEILEFVISSKTPPTEIKAKVFLTNSTEKKEQKKQFHDPEILKLFEKDQKSSIPNNLTDDDCIFALADFSFERSVIDPPKKRGIIFILVDTLKADTTYNPEIMPHINNFIKTEGIQFSEHRAQGNMTVPSIIPLMTSKYSREIGTLAFTYAADPNLKKNFYDKNYSTLAMSMQNLGYRVGAIGWLSLFTEAMEGGLDLGFHNSIVSETPEYETRQITELMGKWLENYGDAPFFLYLHYNTMHGPYKPPMEEIDYRKFLSKPFGLNQKRQLYNGAARYFDNEFLNIIQKLKDLGIYDEVDIVFTADHGAQLDVKEWNYFSGVHKDIDGGYADKGNSLFDEEVRVPLILKLSNNNAGFGLSVNVPTAHVDLMPTLLSLAGQKSDFNHLRGINLFPALDNSISFSELLKNRNTIYFDGHKYAGILYWGNGFQESPMKYIRQLAPDSVKLYLTHNPWSQKINWYQPEMHSYVDFNHHTEKLAAFIPNEKLLQLRDAYFKNTPSDKIIRLTPKYSGKLDFKIHFNTKNTGKLPKIILSPQNIKSQTLKKADSIQFYFTGEVNPNEGIWLNLGDSEFEKLDVSHKYKIIGCPSGLQLNLSTLKTTLNQNTCTYFPPPDGVVESNYNKNEKVIVIQKTLSNEQVEQIEGKGAGEALKNALREWGYAK